VTITPEDLADADVAEDTESWERGYKALTMRNAGATWAKIAANFDVSPQQIRYDVRRVMREIVKVPVDEMVARQRAILLDITRVNYPAALGGDASAQAMLMKVLEHEAKLYGLYAPTRVQVGISESEFAAQAAELLEALGTEPLRALAGEALPVVEGEVLDDGSVDNGPEPVAVSDWSNV